MSDYKIPELPSDDELGITKEDLEKYGQDDEPEMTEAERKALLGDAPAAPPRAPASGTASAKAPPGAKKPGTPPGASPAPPAAPPGKKAAPAPGEPQGPRSRWAGPAMLAALLVGAFFTSSYRALPSPEPANAPDTVFSSARAMAHLVEIARRPHPPGSPAHAQVRGYLLERLRDLGLEPTVQATTSMIGRGQVVRAATVRNIVARIPGRASTGAVVLTAHYDGREIARAAGDDGSGVVAILEIARALLAGPRLDNDVLLVLTDAEELGLLGARAFVDEHPAMADVKAVVSLEMRGAGGPSIMFETGADNGWIVRALKASGAKPFANSMSWEVYRRLPNDTDFTPFREAGRQGLNFAAIGRASVYHQSYDSPENLSEATLQHHGENGLAVARYLASTPLIEVQGPDVSFFSAPGVGLVVYDVGMAFPLGALVLILALVALLPVRKVCGRWSGIGVGLLLGVATVAGAAGAGYGLMRWLPRFHPEYGSLHGSAFHNEGWYVAALAATSLALATALFGVARRRFRASELAWGALLLPLAGMAWATFAFPAGAANLQLPLAAALLGVLALTLPSTGKAGPVVWVLLLALALPVLAILVPVAEFVWLGLSLRAAPVVGGVLALTVLLLLPALDRLREPNGWWAPLTTFLAGAALVAAGIRAAAPDPLRPAPSTLAYVLDHGTGEALWVTDTSEEPVDEEARAWAGERAGAAFGETRPLERYGFGAREPRVAQAPTHAARGPELWALADTVVEGTRRLRLAVRSAVGAELLQFLFPEAGATRLTAVAGRSLPVEERPTRVEHWGSPDPVVILDLEMPEGTALEMDVVEHLLHPAGVLGPDAFQRPPELAPDITWLSDRAVFRTLSGSLELIAGPPPFPLEPENEAPWPAAAPAVTGEIPTPAPVAADSVAAGTVAADTLAAPPDTVRPDTVRPDTGAARR